ncbi:MAG TPA: hypothetical protein VI410_07505, partial [Anaerolineales bacterium]|nr:hypothetical protein [Anaerolineales bacterium]
MPEPTMVRAIDSGSARERRAGAIFLLLVAIALPMAVALGAVAYFDLRSVILPGVHVGGVPVQGYRAEQAAAELDRVWNLELRLTAVDVS